MIRFEMLYEINLTFGLCIKFPRLGKIPVNRPIARVKGLKILFIVQRDRFHFPGEWEIHL